MKIENRITLENMKQNNKRTLITIIGVILCVTMISSVLIMLNSYRLSMVDNVVKRNGFWQYEFKGIDYQKANKLIRDKRIKNAAFVYECASMNQGGDNTTIYAISEDQLDLLGYPLIKGRYPKKNNEILVSNYYLTKNHLSIGDIISYRGDDAQQQSLIQEEKLKIVGIIDSYWDYIGELTIITRYDDNLAKNQNIDVYITLDHLFHTEQQINNLQYTYLTNNQSNESAYDVEIRYNNDLLQFLILKDSRLYEGLILAGGLVCFIVLLSGICVIYNSFTISLSERTQYLGILSSIGATQKQKKKMIRFEAFIIGIIALPIGFLLSIGLVYSLFFIFKDIITENSSGGLVLKMHLHWVIFICVSIYTLLLLRVASYIPAKRASKINAVEAIRQTRDIKVTKRNNHSYRIYKKLFGIEGILAIKNMKRYPSRYRSILMSLIVSFVLVISAISFSNIINQTIINNLNRYYDIELIQYANKNSIQLYDEKELKKYQQVSNADDIHMVLTSSYRIQYEDYISDDGKNLLEKLSKKDESIKENFNHINIFGIQDKELLPYCKALGISMEELKKKQGYILVNSPIKDQNGIRQIIWMNDKKINNFKIYYRDKNYNHPKELLTKIHIMKNTGIEPKFKINDSFYLIAPFQTVNQMIYNQKEKSGDIYDYINVFYKSSKCDFLEKELEKFNSENVYINNIEKSNRSVKEKINLLIIGICGFIGMLILIACTNIINTIFISIQLRSREFAMLKSMGITKKQLHRMILYEGLFYSVKTFVYGMFISIAIAILLSKIFATSFANQIYIPWFGIGVTILILYLLLNSIMIIAIKKIEKQNIIDTIRKDSI